MRQIDYLHLTLAVLALLVVSEGVSYGGHLEPFKGVIAAEGNPLTREKIELGKKLFFDRRLSGDGTMSCATCHIRDMAFTDGQDISMSYPTTRNWRNAPTLMNVSYYRHLFHDGRAGTLEDQALFPVMSPFEMNQNLEYLVEELRSVPEYVSEFKAVFGSGVSQKNIAMALAAFQRTLVSSGAPLDDYLEGNEKALTEEATHGFYLFVGKAGCSKCHFGPALKDDRFHALNVPENPAYENDPRMAATRRFVAKLNHFKDYETLDVDPGRYLVTLEKKDWRAFRTPTLREVSLTGPYMHNGIFSTLMEVIEFFNSGGGKDNTAGLKPLELDQREKKALEVFLTEALTGDEIEFKNPLIP